MWKYIIRRLLISIPVLLGITLVIFLLANLMPGDVVDFMMSSEAPMSKDLIPQLRESLGLDQSIPIRYVLWLKELLKGNLGYSYLTYARVGSLIAKRILPTLELMGISLLISVVVGVLLGIITALKQYSLLDYILTVLGFLGRSIPIFFIGMLLIYFFALRIPIFPVAGMITAGANRGITDNIWHLILPLTSLSILRIAEFLRYSRASMLEVLHSDFIWMARSKGLKEKWVIFRHAFGNALIPIITLLGLNIPVLFSGAIIIETVFQWPGLGTLFIFSINQRDYPVLMGLSLILSIIVLLSNLLTDIIYSFVDPRIKYE